MGAGQRKHVCLEVEYRIQAMPARDAAASLVYEEFRARTSVPKIRAGLAPMTPTATRIGGHHEDAVRSALQ